MDAWAILSPVSVPDIPRDSWIEHPRYESQTLLLGSHEAFRRRSDWTIERVESLDGSDAADARRRTRWLSRGSTDFDWWMAGMKSHERYEESKLYPYLVRKYGVAVDALEAGHRVLDARKLDVQRTFRGAMASDAEPVAALGALLTALRAHRGVLRDHLHAEEDMVIPMLLALTPDEFREYANTPITRLLASMP